MEQLQNLKRRTNATKSLFRSPHEDEEPEFLAEDEQEELIESLRVSNEKANAMFKFVLLAFSYLEAASHLGFATYSWYKRSGFSHGADRDKHGGFKQSASPLTATLCSLISFAIGMAIIKDTKLVRKESVAVWTVSSLVPLYLMLGSGDFSFEWLWWSMPLMLQVVDLTSLWVMQEPEEEFFGLEKSRYKLKGA